MTPTDLTPDEMNRLIATELMGWRIKLIPVSPIRKEWRCNKPRGLGIMPIPDFATAPWAERMMAKVKERELSDAVIDALCRGSKRWLKTALHATFADKRDAVAAALEAGKS